MKSTLGLGWYTTRIRAKQTTKNEQFFSDHFGVKEPRHSETTNAKKRYTSTVAFCPPQPFVHAPTDSSTTPGAHKAHAKVEEVYLFLAFYRF